MAKTVQLIGVVGTTATYAITDDAGRRENVQLTVPPGATPISAVDLHLEKLAGLKELFMSDPLNAAGALRGNLVPESDGTQVIGLPGRRWLSVVAAHGAFDDIVLSGGTPSNPVNWQMWIETSGTTPNILVELKVQVAGNPVTLASTTTE